MGEALVRLADVGQPRVVQQDLLQDESGNLADKMATLETRYDPSPQKTCKETL